MPKVSVRSSGTGITDGCEPPRGCLEPSPNPMQEQLSSSFWDRASLCPHSWPGTWQVCLPSPLECWDQRYVPPLSTFFVLKRYSHKFILTAQAVYQKFKVAVILRLIKPVLTSTIQLIQTMLCFYYFWGRDLLSILAIEAWSSSFRHPGAGIIGMYTTPSLVYSKILWKALLLTKITIFIIMLIPLQISTSVTLWSESLKLHVIFSWLTQ